MINYKRALIVYDSFFGNTEKIAEAIVSLIGTGASAVRVQDILPEQLNGLELLIVGSPTRGFRPSEPIQKFLNAPEFPNLEGVKVAAFDTRLVLETINSKFFRFMVDKGGYASKSIAGKLRKKGGLLIAEPEGFFVTGESGPLKEGEEIRAGLWAKAFCSNG